LVPEEQDVHADHEAYHHEQVKYDGCLSSHPFVLLAAAERSKGGTYRMVVMRPRTRTRPWTFAWATAPFGLIDLISG
jgi:hypothetical protein